MLHPVNKDMDLYPVPATVSDSFHQAADFMLAFGKTINGGPKYHASVGGSH
jgi:hypothetical protein